MTGSLLVVNSHGLDLLTTIMVLQHVSISGESNPIVQAVYLSAGLLGVMGLKALGVALMVVICRGSHLRTTVATVAGLGLAALNLISYSIVT